MQAQPFKMHRLLLSFLILFIFQIHFSQGPPQGSYGGGESPFKITGKVIDKDTKIPMEYCTVSLFKADGSLVGGNITDETGTFVIDKLVPGNFYLEVSFLGFEKQKIESVTLSKENMVTNVGTISLMPNAEQIQEVEVSGIRSNVKYEIDKKVINVDKQIAASSGSAVDVLENSPAVQVDVEGNVSLRGSQGFQVLINGRPSVLDANEALKQIPASSIENIEIITNPSAKYDAEGTAGIINVITKKDSQKGFSGMISARAGLYENYGGDITLSYNAGKVTYSLSGSYNDRNSPTFLTSELETNLNGNVVNTQSTGLTEWKFRNYNIKPGIEIRPNDFNTINLAFSYGGWKMFVDNELNFTQENKTTNTVSEYSSINDTERGAPFYQGQVDYTLKFNNKSHIMFHTSYAKRDFEEEVYNYEYDAVGNLADAILSTEGGPVDRVRINLDYTYPVQENGKIELGFMQNIGWSADDNQGYDFILATEEFVENQQFASKVDYTRNVRAFYGTYSNKWKKLGYQLGVRTENTDRTISVSGTTEEYKIQGLDFFPSLHFSYNITEKNQLFASYSRRINRPPGWQLEPNTIWLDANTLWSGDPNIKPRMIGSYELGWLKYFKEKGSFSLEIYYRNEQNVIEFVRSAYSEDVILMQPTNVGTQHSAGVEARLNIKPFKWWDVDITGNTFGYKLNADLNGNTFDRKGFAWNTGINNYFVIKKNTKIQFDGRYNSKQKNAQGEFGDFFSFNAGISQSFLKRALTISLQARDLFNTTAYEQTNNVNQDYYLYNKRDPKSPRLMLNVSYRINNYRAKRPQGYEDNDDF